MGAVAVVVVLVAIVATVKILPRSDAPSQAVPTTAITGQQTGHATAALPAGDALSSASAGRIARRWFIRRDVARFQNNDAVLTTLETGAALRVDLAFTRSILCHCEPPKHSHVLHTVNVVVPSAHSSVFLGHFAATASNGFPAGYTVVFTRVANSWKAALIVLDGHHATIKARPHGDSGSATSQGSVIRATAAYLMHWLVSGAAPRSRLTWTGTAHYAGVTLAMLGQDKIDPRTNVRRMDYSEVAEPQTYTFGISGGTLSCGVIDEDDLASSPSGRLFQDAQRHNWGPSVAPGVYPTLRERTTLETCVIARPHGVRDLLSAYGTHTSTQAGPGPAV